MTPRLNWQTTMTNNIETSLSNQVNNQSIIPSTDVTQFTFTHFEDDYRTGCQNSSHCQRQQSYSGLRSPGRPSLTYFLNDPWIKTFYMLRITIPKQRHSNRESKAANHVAIIHVKNNYWKEKNNALKTWKNLQFRQEPYNGMVSNYKCLNLNIEI